MWPKVLIQLLKTYGPYLMDLVLLLDPAKRGGKQVATPPLFAEIEGGIAELKVAMSETRQHLQDQVVTLQRVEDRIQRLEDTMIAVAKERQALVEQMRGLTKLLQIAAIGGLVAALVVLVVVVMIFVHIH